MTINPKKVLVLNGPNLNLLGQREPTLYGATTLVEVEQALVALGHTFQLSVQCLQSNSEGALVDAVHQAAREGVAFAIVNAGAYTHTSIALRDAFAGTALPFIEVHISNIHARETFRHHSHLSSLAKGVIVGMGVKGYEYALQHVAHLLQSH